MLIQEFMKRNTIDIKKDKRFHFSTAYKQKYLTIHLSDWISIKSDIIFSKNSNVLNQGIQSN